MKALKWILIIVVVLAIVVFGIGLMMPGTVHTEREIVVNQDMEVVFDQVNNLHNWEAWSYWDNIDPDMQTTYEGPESGVGAKKSWKSEHESVGVGSQEITASEVGEKVDMKLWFDGQGEGSTGWNFEQTEEGVKVTVWMDIEMGMNPIGRMMGGMIDEQIGGDFEKTLANLKEHAEGLESGPKVEIAEVTTDAMWVLGIRETVDMEGMMNVHGRLYGELMKYTDSIGAQMAGQPIAIYYSEWGDMSSIDIECAIPITDSMAGTDRILIHQAGGGNAIKASHWGWYDKLGDTHMAVAKKMKEMGKEKSGPYWEQYVTDPTSVEDTMAIETHIYIPVE